jgi:6-phosphogluconolactonase (cycloisomerase 2 family)
MKRLIGYTAALCLLAITVGCGGVTSTGTLAYISNSNFTGFTVYTVNSDGTLTTSNISPLPTPAAPKVMQFSANGKWAYFLDNTGTNIYGFTRAGNGTFAGPITNSPFPVGPGASSLAIAPGSASLYVALPNTLSGALAAFSIDAGTGTLTQVGSNLQLGTPMAQLVMAPNGSALYGISPGVSVTSGKEAVLTFTITSSSGIAQLANTYSVGVDPVYMVLSTNGNFMYVLDHTATTNIANVANCSGLTNCTPTGPSPNFYGFTVAGTTLTPLAGANGGTAGGNNVFNENADLATGQFPSNPIAGATSNDSRYLFIANQGSHNVSAFRLLTTGEPTEVLGALTTVNGIVTSTASPFPCCQTPSFVAVAPANNAMYVLDTPAGKIFQFAINQSTGQIRALRSASVGAESATSNPTWITFR